MVKTYPEWLKLWKVKCKTALWRFFNTPEHMWYV